jgi:hypothetical protein
VSFPDIIGVALSNTSADAMYCYVASPVLSVSGATTIRASTTAGSTTVGLAVYQDGDSGAVVAKGSVGHGSDGPVAITGLGPFTLTGGTSYRFCLCTRNAANYLTSYANNSPPYARWANAFATVVGTAANGCTTGVPPTTTGALTPQSIPIPIMAVE